MRGDSLDRPSFIWTIKISCLIFYAFLYIWSDCKICAVDASGPCNWFHTSYWWCVEIDQEVILWTKLKDLFIFWFPCKEVPLLFSNIQQGICVVRSSLRVDWKMLIECYQHKNTFGFGHLLDSLIISASAR